MARTVVLTEVATRRFKKAVYVWWSVSGKPGDPGADRIAAALNCDRRTVMQLRNHQPNDRNLLVALFAAQAKEPPAKDYLALWELTGADFEDAHFAAMAGCLMTEAGQLYQGAEYDAAENRCREALALYLQIENRGGEAGCHQLMSRLELARGKFDLALEHIKCAISINRKEKNVWQSADLLEMRGTIFLRECEWERSREDYTASLALWKAGKNLRAMADAEMNLAGLETKVERAPQARTHLENARNIIETLKDAPLRASLMLQEARLLLLEGKPEAATACANKALDYWTFADHPRWKAFSRLVLAEIAAKQRQFSAASEQAALSLKLYEQVGDQYGAKQARLIMVKKMLLYNDVLR